jgi:DNA ligase-1
MPKKAKKRKLKVMLAKQYNPKRIENWEGMYAEPKSDGIRVLVTIDGRANVIYYSRNGRALDMLSHLDHECRKMALTAASSNEAFENGTALDCELVSNTGNFGDVAGAIHRKNHVAKDARLLCFHMMPLSSLERGKDTVKQLKRHRMAGRIIERRKLKFLWYVPPIKVDSHEDVMHCHGVYRSNGDEGTMVKDLYRRWEGKRSDAWLKIKDEKTVDVRVVGMKEGAGKYKGTLGALIVDYRGKEVPVSGMTDDQRRRFWSKPKSIVGKLVEVEFQEETVHGSLRHPRYKRHRPDKDKRS